MESAKVTDTPMTETVPETLEALPTVSEANRTADSQMTDHTESATENLQPMMNVQPSTDGGVEEQKTQPADPEHWTPPPKRRPEDEFFDLKSIVPLRVEKITDDGSVEIIVVEEGSGNLVEDTDTVYYRHEHRFDNGQLVDLNETRRVDNKLVMNDD